MQKIRIDFDNPGLPQHISAVENDSQSRFFQAMLYENGKAYTAPEGAAYSIMYRGFGPQNQGWYDTINDGAGKRAACAVSGNVVTCEIARQALQVPGHTSFVLCVTTGNGYMLKSWPIECDCKNDRYDSTAEIQSFFYITQVSNADWNRAIQALEELKNTIDPTLSLSGKAADAKATGDALKDETERAKEVENKIKEAFIVGINAEWIIGELNADGTVNTRNTGLRFASNVYLKKGATITITELGYNFNVARYTANNPSVDNFIIESYKTFASGDTYTVTEDTWLMCSIWHLNNSAFSDTTESSVVTIKYNASLDYVYRELEDANNQINALKFNDTPLNKNANIYYGIVPTDYYNGLQSDYVSDGFGRDTTFASLISKFDTLVDGVYVTKTDKGVSSDGENQIYEYDFVPVASTLTNKTKTQPKVLIISGQHGFEKASIYGLFYFLKDLKENWENSKVLDYIRHHVIIKVIPCANPYGFNNNTYWNANGVNINRNYATSGWVLYGEPYTSSYTGAAAGSENETQIISNFVENNSDSMIFIDFHTNGQYAVSDYTKINWFDFVPIADAFFDYFKYFACAHVETITAHFSKDYNLGLTTQLCGKVTSGEDLYSANLPTADVYALEHDVVGHTIEGFTGFPNGTDFSADALKGNSEIIGNWIKAVIYGTHLMD